jgi:hypothetical protein
MKKLKLVSLFVGGFVLGGIAVNLWWGHILSRMTVSKEVEMAAKTAFEAEWLAQLRLGETKSAIESLERSMDIDVVTIAQWAETSPQDGKTRMARDRWLVPVKVYHESYPARGDEAARVNSLLATVPGRNPQSACKSGICRLDDLRLATLTTKTNSP